MTVDELVRLLTTYPPDQRVVVNGYEDGYDDLSEEQIVPVNIALNTGKHDWEGRHGDADGPIPGAADGVEVVEAVALRRVSN